MRIVDGNFSSKSKINKFDFFNNYVSNFIFSSIEVQNFVFRSPTFRIRYNIDHPVPATVTMVSTSVLKQKLANKIFGYCYLARCEAKFRSTILKVRPKF